MKKKIFIAFLLMLARASTVSSQVVPPPVPPPPPPGLPIDGGVMFLTITGILYGVRKFKD